MVQVSLEDWGRLLWRRMNDVYLLEERFQQLPWQGIICGLAYTGPVTDTSTWPKETNDLCRLLLEGQRGWIKIVHPLRRGAALVKLEVQPKNSPNGTYDARDTLIQLGHAELRTKVTVDVYPAI
ncbi:hypothetical protein RF55_19756 [Lasius niger]|uniref:Uncharacterized protein n=1 Tax=Lasius niger TaxID=67767 RepID=A0A0J7JZB9_LASNI|nr:hypothetical protein RF55_19756 [Lasius niger]